MFSVPFAPKVPSPLSQQYTAANTQTTASMKTPLQQAWSVFTSAFSRSRERATPIMAAQTSTSNVHISQFQPQPQPQPQPDQERSSTHLNTANEDTPIDAQCNSGCPQDSHPITNPAPYLHPMHRLPMHTTASTTTLSPGGVSHGDYNMDTGRLDSAPIMSYCSPMVPSLAYTSFGHQFEAPIPIGSSNVDTDWQMADEAPVTFVAGSSYGPDVRMECQHDVSKPVQINAVDVEMADVFDEPDHRRFITQAATPTVGLASSSCCSAQDDDPLSDIPTATLSPSFAPPTPIVLAPAHVAVPEIPASLVMASNASPVVAADVPRMPVETTVAPVKAPWSQDEADIAQVQEPVSAPPSAPESAPAPAPVGVAQTEIVPMPLSASAPVEAVMAVPQDEPAPAELAPAAPTSTVSASDSPMTPVPSQLPSVPGLHYSSSSSSSSNPEPESPRTPALPTPPPFAPSKPQESASYRDILADVIFGQRAGDASLMRLARRERNRLKDMANVLGVVKPKKAPKSSPVHAEHNVSGGVQSRRAVGVSPYQRAAAARKAQRRRVADEDDDMGLESGSAFWPPPVAAQEEEEDDDDDDERVRQGMAEYSQAQDVFKNALVSMGVMDANQFRPLQLTNEETVEELPDYDDNEDGDSDSDDSSVATVEDAAPATPVSEKAAEDFILSTILGVQDGVMA